MDGDVDAERRADDDDVQGCATRSTCAAHSRPGGRRATTCHVVRGNRRKGSAALSVVLNMDGLYIFVVRVVRHDRMLLHACVAPTA